MVDDELDAAAAYEGTGVDLPDDVLTRLFPMATEEGVRDKDFEVVEDAVGVLLGAGGMA